MNGHDWMDQYDEEELEKITYEQDLRELEYEAIMNSEWRPIDGHPMYEVSPYGYVRSWKSGEPRILKTWPNQYGHRYVGVDGERLSVHRLVAQHYISNPYGYNVVRHLNDDPRDNEACNLAWGTQADNVRDCINHGRAFVKSVYCYETDRIYRSCAEAACDLGTTRSAITFCCQGKIHSCGGYHLCYLKDKNHHMNHLDEWLDNRSPYKPVKATNLATGEEIIFHSRKDAAEHLGIPNCGISSTIAGRTPHSHGWRFENYG